MKLLKKYIAIILGVTLFIHILNAATAYNLGFWEYFFKGESIITNLSYNIIIITFVLTYYSFLERKFNWEKDGIKLFFLGLIGSTLLVILALLIGQYIHSVLILDKQTTTEFILTLPKKKNHFIFSAVISVCISLFFIAYGFIKATQEKKVKEQKIIANTATAKFDALRNQLDPHFLFNSLNVLTSLIYEDQDSAQQFTTDLAKVYRYILEQKTKDVVPLKDEVKFGKTYISLLQKRFEDSLTVSFPKNLENPEGKIIPLSLQLLLENAVKHNIVSASQPLHIDIFEKDGFLHIKNNLQQKTVMQSSTGVGLSNIKTRYEMLKTKTFEVYKTPQTFVAKLPILNKDTIVVDHSESMDVNEAMAYEDAQSRVRKIKEFYYNLGLYIVCVIAMFILNKIYSPNHLWVIYPVIGWGAGVLSQALIAYGRNPFISTNWEQRKLRKLLDEGRIFGKETQFDKRKQIAYQYVIKIREFYQHLTTFLIVMPSLCIINYIQNQWNFPWFLYPFLGWGIGVFFHAVYTFRSNFIFNSEWEDKQIKKILDQQNNNKS